MINKEDIRANNIKVAQETLQICKDKKYILANGNEIDLSNQLDQSQKYTVLWDCDESIKSLNLIYQQNKPIVPFIEIVDETTIEGAKRYLDENKPEDSSLRARIAALNFASGVNPGGGFLSGSTAQEEDLCRASGLYPCLKKQPIYYNLNNKCNNSYYTNNIIYSPDVPFFRNRYNSLLEEPFDISIITAPAPCIRNMEVIDEEYLQNVLDSRAIKILQVAAYYCQRNIILGAWGCGAFGNKPEMVISAFKNALQKVPYFEYVCFSIFDNSPEKLVFNSFANFFK